MVSCPVTFLQEMIEVSSLLEEAVGKRSKSKETRRKLKVTDSNEARNLTCTLILFDFILQQLKC